MDNNLILAEIQKLEVKLGTVQLPGDLYEKAHLQLERLNLSLKYGGNANQLDLISKYFDWITAIPWVKKTEDILDIAKAKEIMDRNHYGLDSIKKRIFEYLSILILQKKNNTSDSYHAPILFFVGLAGTGKTTFAKSIAESLGRKFIRIPFGGLSSALDLRGLSRVQMEAEPGLLIKSICRVGVKNPVILLDELDRITPESRAAVMGVLIELLDPEQNSHFIDHYIDYPIDLSQVIFVATANNTQNISTAVMDRLEVLQMPSYSDLEKITIAKNYILPRLLKESGLPQGTLTIEDIVWQKIARQAGFDPGIRSVERYAEGIVRKVAFEYVSGKAVAFNIGEINMKEYIS